MTLIFKTLGVALITAGLMAGAQAGPVALSAVIDFDEPASSLIPSRDVRLGDVISNQYARFGVEFTTDNVVACSGTTNPNCTAPRQFPPPPHLSSPNFLMNRASGSIININVLDGFSLTSLRLDVFVNNTAFNVKFFDANSVELATPLALANGSANSWLTADLFGFNSAVRRIEFGGGNSTVFAIDYLRFDYVANRSNLPEPAMLSLVALALTGVGLSRRRKA